MRSVREPSDLLELAFGTCVQALERVLCEARAPLLDAFDARAQYILRSHTYKQRPDS